MKIAKVFVKFFVLFLSIILISTLDARPKPRSKPNKPAKSAMTEIPKELQISSGSVSVTVKGTLNKNTEDVYYFKAYEKQNLSAAIASRKGNVRFLIETKTRNVWRKMGRPDIRPMRTRLGKSDKNQYRIKVGGDADSYELFVGIDATNKK